ncbi:DUF1707 SHOCT-like domain-containing protein [Streptacidiphilus rugosus]|uniref:DUF1707 SHOCT-like domain-containing protein n=1 Tax=Streptacidiphilus rugosus TaxID=405783 RepID=UPI00056D2399|nr:DUF1707 domain-containing protein [Streptacidiphilus rugosus]
MDNSSSPQSPQSPQSPDPDRLPQASLRKPHADPADELRASDADRERVAEALRDAYAEGRLDAEEHSQRLDAAYAAKTMGELVPLTRDLPATGARATSAPASMQSPAGGDYITPDSNELVAIFGGAQRKGRFRAGRRLSARAVFGGVEIDLTEAVFDGPELVIECRAIFGGIDIKVPETVGLRGGGTGIFGGFDVSESAGTDASGPVVTIRGKAIFGGVAARRHRAELDRGQDRKSLD